MDKIVAVKLPVPAWNIIVNALAQRPYVEVADLLAHIKIQIEQQFDSHAPEPGQNDQADPVEGAA